MICQLIQSPGLLLRCVCVDCWRNKRIRTPMLEMLSSLWNMMHPMLRMRDNMLTLLAILAGRIWQARSRKDISSKNRLLDLRWQRLRVQQDRFVLTLLDLIHKRVAAVDLRRNLSSCWAL